MSYISSYYHCVFGTKDRRPFITPQLRERLWPFLGGIARPENPILGQATAPKIPRVVSHSSRFGSISGASRLPHLGTQRPGGTLHPYRCATSRQERLPHIGVRRPVRHTCPISVCAVPEGRLPPSRYAPSRQARLPHLGTRRPGGTLAPSRYATSRQGRPTIARRFNAGWRSNTTIESRRDD